MSEVLGCFNKVMRKFAQFFKSLEEGKVAGELGGSAIATEWSRAPITQSIDEELVRGAWSSPARLSCLHVCRQQ